MEVETVNRLARFCIQAGLSCGLRLRHMAIAKRVLVMVLMPLASGLSFSQQRHVVLDDAKVQVTRIDLAPDEAYTPTKEQGGAVWIALDSLVLKTNKGGQDSIKLVRRGESASVDPEASAQFGAESGRASHMLLVEPKTVHQELTVSPFVLSGSLEDASDRNATLLIALSNCHFRDTRNLGDESEWVPSKPEMVVMMAGGVKWIRPGIHHFRNLGSSPARMVSIEWRTGT